MSEMRAIWMVLVIVLVQVRKLSANSNIMVYENREMNWIVGPCNTAAALK